MKTTQQDQELMDILLGRYQWPDQESRLNTHFQNAVEISPPEKGEGLIDHICRRRRQVLKAWSLEILHEWEITEEEFLWGENLLIKCPDSGLKEGDDILETLDTVEGVPTEILSALVIIRSFILMKRKGSDIICWLIGQGVEISIDGSFDTDNTDGWIPLVWCQLHQGEEQKIE